MPPTDFDLTTLLGLLPPEYATYVAIFAELVFAFSLLAMGVKKLLGEPKEDDGPYRRAFFWVASWIDVLAANTATVRQQRATSALKAEVKQLAAKPPWYEPGYEDEERHS